MQVPENMEKCLINGNAKYSAKYKGTKEQGAIRLVIVYA